VVQEAEAETVPPPSPVVLVEPLLPSQMHWALISSHCPSQVAQVVPAAKLQKALAQELYHVTSCLILVVLEAVAVPTPPLVM
jgi:hypothetical protein